MKKNSVTAQKAEVINATDVIKLASGIVREAGETTKACTEADSAAIKELMGQYNKAESLEEKQMILNQVDKISERTHKKESEYKYFTLKLAGGVLIAIGAIYGIGNYSSLKDAVRLLETAA